MMKKIKILYIVPSLNSGGAERFLLDLISNLDKNIFEVYLLLFKEKGFFYQEAIDNNLNVFSLNKKRKIDLINFYKIYKYIKKIKPDIVHTQLGGDIYGKIAAKIAFVPIIVSTEQNVLVNDKKLIIFFKKISSKFSNKIIAISSAVKRDIINIYKFPESKIELIFNGINLNKFSSDIQENKKNNSNEVIIGSIGRLSKQKNYSLLIRALSSFKDKNFKLLIAGEGELRHELEREINFYNLQSKISLLGEINNVKSFFSELDFFVLPSKWEGLGIVLLEAGLSSLPILASATGGILDVIDDKKTGILFENDNLEDLKEKLNYFFDQKNKEELLSMGINLKKFISTNFDIKVISEKYQKIYLDLFNN